VNDTFTPFLKGRYMQRNVVLTAVVLAALAGLSTPAKAQLVNGGFELPQDSPGTANFNLFNDAVVPGWQTTATDSMIEIWSDSFLGVTSFEGAQHAELNANQISTLFQDVSGIPVGGILGFEFAHRGRAGIDTLRLTITDLGANNVLGGGDDTQLFSSTYSTDNTAWAFYTNAGEPAIISLGNTTRFAYESVSAAGGNNAVGNFLDAANFGVGVGVAAPEPGSLALVGLAGLPLAGTILRRRRRTA
jgi:hypothetical protein